MPQRVDSAPQDKKCKKCSSESQLPNANCGEEEDGQTSMSASCMDSELNSVMSAMTMQKNEFKRDPHEVLRASLEFERSSSFSRARQFEQQRQSKSRNGSAASLTSSASSLYPSMESVNRAAGYSDFEADWYNADVSGRKTTATTTQSSSTRTKSKSNPSHRGPATSTGRHNSPLSEAELLDDAIPTMIATGMPLVEATRTAPSGLAEAAAEVTIVEYETIHPLEEESVVQAELVNQDAKRLERDQQSLTNHSYHNEATLGALCDETENIASTCGPSLNTEVATEATVIESGPLEKATIAAWSGDSTEVVVLPQESHTTPFENIDDTDAKTSLQNDNRAMVDSIQEEFSQQTLVTECEGADINMLATVVENGYGIHPSESTDHSVQAELVGNSSTNNVGSDGVAMISPSNDGDGNVATEATVLDCGPLDKATVDAWSAPEEAHVIRDENCPNISVTVEEEEQKAPTCTDASVQDISTRIDDQTEIQGKAQSGDNQAEIVEISESLHPAELEIGSATPAQLIGNSNSAFPDSVLVYEDGATADVIVEEASNQAQLIPAVEAQSRILNEVDSQDMKLPATINDDENIPFAAIEGDRFQSYPQQQTIDITQSSIANDLVNLNGNHASVPIQTSPTECEVLGEFRPGTQSIGEYIDRPRPFASTATPSDSSSTGSARNSDRNRHESTLRSVQALTKNISRGTNNVMEILFGDTNLCRSPLSFEMDSLTTSISPRILLPSSMIYSEATQSWVATLSTSQKALDADKIAETSKALRAFEVPTEKQAKCLAKAWAPPKMHPFASNPQCFICRSQFAVLRRPSHCRNCGVCICNSCTVQWPSKMIPATYNIKDQCEINVCKACDWLCSAFRLALLKGERDKAIAIHATGNINLTTPFANIKGEVFYPVHCAVLGRSLWLLKWLVEDNCCPLKSIRVGSGGRGASKGSYTPILTSKSRSLLSIALSNNSIDIMRYLVVEKHMLLHEERNLPMETLLQSLDSILRVLPEGTYDLQTQHETLNEPESSDIASLNNAITPTSMENDSELETTRTNNINDNNNARTTSPSNECILCCSNQIDCVVMPCGHQMCCLECSNNISRCPVCQSECSFVRVYRA